MKKLIVFCLFFIGLLPVVIAQKRTTIVKVDNKMTIYTTQGCKNNNYWGENVKITKEDVVLPDDSYYRNLNIPEEEWKVFSIKQNGIYDSYLEKVIKENNDLLGSDGLKKIILEKDKLQRDYDKVFKEKTRLIDWINSLEISKEQLRKDYNKLFAEKSDAVDLINILEITIAVLVLLIIFLIFKMVRTNFQKKLESARM